MDLNLTRVFVAIYEARSLTAAGQRLFVTQSAVSQALGRLRDQFDDALFERAGQGVHPTPLADAIYPDLRDGVATLERAIDAVHGFDPATTERTFRIALSELGEVGWLPAIADTMATQAPLARLDIAPLRANDLEDQLTRGTIDLAITPLHLAAALERRVVKREGYRVIMSSDNPLASRDLGVAEYRNARRVWVGSDSSAELIAAAHHREGIPTDAMISTQHFASLPPLLARSTDLIAVVPDTLAVGWSSTWPLATSPLPFEMPPVQLQLYRRTSTQHTGALNWFYGAVEKAISGFPGGFEGIAASR